MKTIEGAYVTLEKAQEMIKTVDQNNDGKLSKDEFVTLMKPHLLNEFLNAESDIEDIRNFFRDADTDFSGYLTIDEFYLALIKMGTDLKRDEVVSLFSEFDVNQDR